MAKVGEWVWKAHKRVAVRADDPHGEVASLEPIYRELHYCLRTDRTLLKKRVSAYPDHFRDGELWRFDMGWKVRAKVKEGEFENLADILRGKGFDIEYAR